MNMNDQEKTNWIHNDTLENSIRFNWCHRNASHLEYGPRAVYFVTRKSWWDYESIQTGKTSKGSIRLLQAVPIFKCITEQNNGHIGEMKYAWSEYMYAWTKV